MQPLSTVLSWIGLDTCGNRKSCISIHLFAIIMYKYSTPPVHPVALSTVLSWTHVASQFICLLAQIHLCWGQTNTIHCDHIEIYLVEQNTLRRVWKKLHVERKTHPKNGFKTKTYASTYQTLKGSCKTLIFSTLGGRRELQSSIYQQNWVDKTNGKLGNPFPV